jgi:hypothetical protein
MKYLYSFLLFIFLCPMAVFAVYVDETSRSFFCVFLILEVKIIFLLQ